MKLILKEYHINMSKKVKYYDSESYSEVNAMLHKGRYKYTSESSESDCKTRKGSINLMKIFKENLKR